MLSVGLFLVSFLVQTPLYTQGEKVWLLLKNVRLLYIFISVNPTATEGFPHADESKEKSCGRDRDKPFTNVQYTNVPMYNVLKNGGLIWLSLYLLSVPEFDRRIFAVWQRSLQSSLA